MTRGVDLAAAPERVWQLIRRGNLASSALVRALFALRTLPDRLRGKHPEVRLCLDDLVSSPEQPGFQLLAEGPQEPRDDLQDVVEGVAGMALMIAAFVSPFLRRARNHWGLDAETAARAYPGDELVKEPRWGWTHGVTIEASAAKVWPWLAQIGADRAGFYSYQWLENLVGCELRNAERIHPEWLARVGQELILASGSESTAPANRSRGSRALSARAALAGGVPFTAVPLRDHTGACSSA